MLPGQSSRIALDRKDYFVSKGISLAFPLALIAFGAFLWAGKDTEYWWFLVMVTMLWGYTHFLLGFWYQIKSFLRRPSAPVALVAFFMLNALALAFSLFLTRSGQATILAMLVVPYFVLHGALNEKSLLRDQGHLDFPTSYFLLLVPAFIGVFVTSLLHPSFNFDANVVFVAIPPFQQAQHIESILHTTPLLIAFGLIAITTIGGPVWALARNKVRLAMATFVFGLLCAVLVFFWSPLNYVYLLFGYLVYHFIVFSIVYLQKFIRVHSPQVRPYLIQHGVLFSTLIALLAVAHLPAASGTWLGTAGMTVFRADVFITVAYMHITSSFMNETWFHSAVDWIWEKLSGTPAVLARS